MAERTDCPRDHRGNGLTQGMNMGTKFAGHLATIDDKSYDTNVDGAVLVEVTDFKADGTVELNFTDRNEDCYLRVRLQDVLAAVASMAGDKSDGA